MSKRRQKAGLPPGAVLFTGKRKVDKITVHYTEYDDQLFQEQTLDNQTIRAFHEPNDLLVQWYDIRGLHDEALISEIGKVFQMNPLFVEDIVDTAQRPKLIEVEQGIFFIAKALTFGKETQRVKTEQISMYIGKEFVLTFQEDATDVFFKIRERLQKFGGRIRKQRADYLAYCLLDWIVDNYFIVLEEIQLAIEQLEEDILQHPNTQHKSTIHQLKQELIKTRKSIAPLREAISQFAKSDSELIAATTSQYLRDVQDHTIQIVDNIDTNRELLNSLQDLYLSEISFKMNQVMQVLTIITTIFVPLSFLAGLYGMNFENMPELHHRYGYFILLGIMCTIVAGLITYFKKKNWF